VTLWTSGDICARYKMSRSSLAYWRRQDGFPEPLSYARNTGGVWDADEVRAWVQAFRAGAPEMREKRVAVVRAYKRGATVSACARNVGVDRKTVYRWLKSAGVVA
jgi:predicted DNA-binding transcriptional regulator AlpA